MKHRYLQQLRLFLAPRGSQREQLVRKAMNGFRSVEHKIKHRLERKKQYDLSVVIVFYNMKREAARTLYSLSRNYQLLGEEISYEVVVLDNGSKEPLDEQWVRSFGQNFRYIYFNANMPSPCEALNYGVKVANGKYVTLCIDGARILSPGILYHSFLAAKAYKNPFVRTLGMHIGSKPQNYLVDEGYSQTEEDQLLASIDWKADGYLLFDVSSLALSAKKGYLAEIWESNCVTMLKSTYMTLGGFDERFKSAGGGLANLDFFNRVNQMEDVSPVMLLGEATFHQFHGGTATNVSFDNHPWKKMEQEYMEIHKKPFTTYQKEPVFFGKIHPKSQHLLLVEEDK